MRGVGRGIDGERKRKQGERRDKEGERRGNEEG